jgi:hypothetical protein
MVGRRGRGSYQRRGATMQDRLVSLPGIVGPPRASDGRDLFDELRERIEGLQAEVQDKPDQAWEVYYHTQDGERLRVLWIRYCGSELFLLIGADENGQQFRAYVHSSALQLVAKLVKLEPKAEKPRIGFKTD